jgi:hypothetical protein
MLTIIFAFLVAKLKGYKIKYLFRAWAVYPSLFLGVVFVFLTVNVFINNYCIAQFASIFKQVYLYSFILPIIFYKLYKPGIIGSGLILTGTLLNKFVMFQNGGKMPVYPTLSYITGYVKPNTFSQIKDIHILGNAGTNFKILTDYIDLGYLIMSIGDLFIHFFSIMIFYYTIKAMNIKYADNHILQKA